MTCNVRCPKGINIAEVIEALRQILLRARKRTTSKVDGSSPADERA